MEGNISYCNDIILHGLFNITHESAREANKALGVLLEVLYLLLVLLLKNPCQLQLIMRGRRGRDRMVVGFTTIYASHH